MDTFGKNMMKLKEYTSGAKRKIFGDSDESEEEQAMYQVGKGRPEIVEYS